MLIENPANLAVYVPCKGRGCTRELSRARQWGRATPSTDSGVLALQLQQNTISQSQAPAIIASKRDHAGSSHRSWAGCTAPAYYSQLLACTLMLKEDATNLAVCVLWSSLCAAEMFLPCMSRAAHREKSASFGILAQGLTQQTEPVCNYYIGEKPESHQSCQQLAYHCGRNRTARQQHRHALEHLQGCQVEAVLIYPLA